MSIDMYLGSSKAQGSSASALSESYQAGFQALQAAVGQFTQDTLLRSQAYDSGKSYFQGVYIPLIQGAILVAEATGKAVEKLPNDYVSQVDSCDLKSSELEAEIQRYETQIQGMQNQMDQIKQLLPVSSERVQHLREARGLISDYTSAKRKLEKQLQTLLAFHAFSSTLFTEVTSLQAAVNQGLAQVSGGKGFDPKTGTFSPKNLKDTRWMITIGNAWDKRQREIAEINRKARVEREMAALQEAAKIAGADIAMNSFMMNVGLMNMGPSIYGNLKDYGSQKALTASLRPTGTISRSNTKVSGVGIPKSSKSSLHYQNYKNDLMKEDIIEKSKPIISGSDLKDPKVISELTKNGSSILDWAKMESTYSYETSMGKGKVHYYRNLKTGEISFYDLKMKVPIPKDLKVREGLTDDFWIIDLDNNFKPKGIR
ncbi:hypothetical protein [Enterococcus sp. AZ192]|uniref:hypothetical protein n=1 Tax=unclassified Enterococcus TaxID=2608891 RepID=UPI003D2B8505